MKVKELKTRFAVKLYMGLLKIKKLKKKKNPSVKSYWARSKMLLWCPIISNVMTRDRFLAGTYVIKLERLLCMTNCTSEEGYWMNLEILA